jgi:hypothetical protein
MLFLSRVGMLNTTSRVLQMSRGTLPRNHHLIVLRFHNWTSHETARGKRDCWCVLRKATSVHMLYDSVINTRANGRFRGKYSSSSFSLSSYILITTWYKESCHVLIVATKYIIEWNERNAPYSICDKKEYFGPINTLRMKFFIRPMIRFIFQF